MSSKASLPPIPLKITNLGALETQMRAVIPAHTKEAQLCMVVWSCSGSLKLTQQGPGAPNTWPGQQPHHWITDTQTLTAQLCSTWNFKTSWFQEAEINKKFKSLEISEEIGREALPPFPFSSSPQPKHTALWKFTWGNPRVHKENCSEHTHW